MGEWSSEIRSEENTQGWTIKGERSMECTQWKLREHPRDKTQRTLKGEHSGEYWAMEQQKISLYKNTSVLLLFFTDEE